MVFPGFNKVRTLGDISAEDAFKRRKEELYKEEVKEEIERGEKRGIARAERPHKIKKFAREAPGKVARGAGEGLKKVGMGLGNLGGRAGRAIFDYGKNLRNAPQRQQGRASQARPRDAFDLLLGSPSPRRSQKISDRGSGFDLIGPDTGLGGDFSIFGNGRGKKKGKRKMPKSLFDF